MRDILFRGKRIDNGEWVEGFYYKMAETTYYLIWRILQLPEIALIIQNYYRRQRSNGKNEHTVAESP